MAIDENMGFLVTPFECEKADDLNYIESMLDIDFLAIDLPSNIVNSFLSSF